MNRIRSACNGGFIGQWKGPPPHLIICYIFNRQTASLLLWPANNIHHSFEKWFGCQFGLQEKCVLEFSLGYLRMVCYCLPLDCKQKHIRNLFYIKTHNLIKVVKKAPSLSKRPWHTTCKELKVYCTLSGLLVMLAHKSSTLLMVLCSLFSLKVC